MHPALPRAPALTKPVLGAARSRMMSEILDLPDPWPPLE
jgi:hypothetical protein